MGWYVTSEKDMVLPLKPLAEIKQKYIEANELVRVPTEFAKTVTDMPNSAEISSKWGN